jgi:tetratricopeptide (TPR) repeat protein
MKKNLIAVISLILFASYCYSSKIETALPKDPLQYEAFYYYSMAETALQLRDLKSAESLLKKAESFAPQEIEIKARLLEVLAAQAKFDPALHNEIINIGERCTALDNCPVKIFILLAESYSFQGNFEKGDQYLKKALDQDPSMNLYLSYYLFRKNQLKDDDLTYLQKALEEDWTDLNTVLMISEIYSSCDPEKNLKILEQAYSVWSEERVLRSILTIYEQRGDTAVITEKIQQHIDAQNETSDFLKSYLINLYFLSHNYTAIVENKNICLELDKEPTLRYLFFSALTLEVDDLALETAEIIIEKNDLPKEIEPLFHAYYGYVLFNNSKYSEAAENFLFASDINLILDMITDYDMMKSAGEKELDIFVSALLETADQLDMAHFLAGYMYGLLNITAKSEEYINRVSLNYLQEKDLVESAAIILLSLDEANLPKAKDLLSKRENQDPSLEQILGFYYYNTLQDSIAYIYFKEEINKNLEPSKGSIIVTSILGEQFSDIPFLLFMMDKALALYPDDPEILNLFGYTIADLQIEEKYSKAEEILTRAIELDPQNSMIWDSVAWLYFRMEKHEKALAAMEKPLAETIDNSEIAYHLGEIYLKLNNTDLAQKYLNLAVELDNDIESVNLSREILKSLNDPEEN